MKINKGIILILISAVGYALMPIFSVKALQEGTAVSTLLFMRFSLASILLWLYIFAKKIPWKTSYKHLIYLIIIGLLGFTIASASIYTAYKYITSSIATLILFTHPIFVMLFEKMISKKKTTSNKIFALITTSIGLFIVLYVKETLSIKGLILSFISSITYGAYCFGLSEKKTQQLNGVTVTAYITTITALAMMIQSFLTKAPLIELNGNTLLSALALSLFSTILASVTFYEGLSLIGPSSATLVSSVEPIIVVIFSSLFLNEIISFNTLLGGIIVVLGIIILEYKKADI